MYVSAWQMNNSASSSQIHLPPLSTLVPDASNDAPRLPMIVNPQLPSGTFVQRETNIKLPSVDMILENINSAAIAQRNMQMSDYAAAQMGPGLSQSQYMPKTIAISPAGGHEFRPAHVRSVSLSNFQFASTFSDKSRSYSFSYTPVRFLQTEDARNPLIPEPPVHRGFSPPRRNVGKKRGRKKKADVKCGQCLSENTPEWRRGPNGSRTLCNACGLFYSKLTKKFGYEDANIIFAYKKKHNEVLDRIVPTTVQRDRFVLEYKDSQ